MLHHKNLITENNNRLAEKHSKKILKKYLKRQFRKLTKKKKDL